jgi:hypothetical protein
MTLGERDELRDLVESALTSAFSTMIMTRILAQADASR